MKVSSLSHHLASAARSDREIPSFCLKTMGTKVAQEPSAACSRLVGNSEVMGENGAHDSASKSASDREQAPIGRSSSDVHEGCHFANCSSRLRDFSAKASAI